MSKYKQATCKYLCSYIHFGSNKSHTINRQSITNVVLTHRSVVVGRSFTPQAHDSLKSIPEKVSGVQITVPRPLLDPTVMCLFSNNVQVYSALHFKKTISETRRKNTQICTKTENVTSFLPSPLVSWQVPNDGQSRQSRCIKMQPQQFGT